MGRLSHIFLYWLLGCLSASSVFAVGPIEFERISKKEGLPSNSITDILQDPYGIMWFGTQNGLVRFDGYDFKLFKHSANDTNTLTENTIRRLAMSKKGHILIAHDNIGFDDLDLQTEKITRIKYSNSFSDDAGLHIITLHTDSEGSIWVGTNHGLSKYDPIQKRFQHFSVSYLSNNTVKYGFVSSIIDYGRDYFLLYLSGSKVIKFNWKTGVGTPFYSLEGKSSTEFIINKGGILFLDGKNLWMGTEFKGLFKIELTTWKTTVYNVENHVLKSNVIMDIKKDSQNRLWIATDGGGVLQYDASSDAFQTYQYDPIDQTSISSNATYAIYEDRAKNVWFGNYATGLNVIMHNKRKFEAYTNYGPDGEKLSYKSVLSFANAGNGRIFIGTDGGGLNVFDPRTKRFRYYTKQNSGICSNIVKSLLNDKEGNVWIGTYASGLCKAKIHADGTFNPHSIRGNDSSTIRHLNVWSLCEDQNRQIWIGLLEAGIDRYSPQSQRFIAYPYTHEQFNGLSGGNIMALMVDNKNNLWAGTEAGGLCLLDRNTHKFTSFKTDGKDSSLPSNDILTLKQDSEGKIWIGTKQGGLSQLLDIKKKKFKNFGPSDGLCCTSVFGILEDDHQNLWISTDNGLFRFDKQRRHFRRFTLEDGLQSLEYNANACFKDSSGFLYFGGPEGFNRFHPDQIWINRSVPKVYISHLKIFHREIEANVPYKDKVYFRKPTYLLDTLELNYSDQSLTLEFVCTNYTNRFNNQFSYRLSGFTSEWDTVDAGKRSATYTNLAPGTYVFQVRASNNDGIWNVSGKKLVIVVHPPWWMTWWAKIVFCLAGALLLIMIYYGRVKQIKLKNKRLATLIRYRTRELESANNSLKERNEEITQMNQHMVEQQNEILLQKEHLEKSNLALNESNATKDKFFSIVAHDLRNPVSALNALTEMLQNNYNLLSEKDRAQIVGHIQTSSSSLKYLVNNLLDWALIQSKHLKVVPTIVNVHKNVEECFKVLQQQAEDKEIVMQNHCDPRHLTLVDENMLKTILRNLISNSIKFSKKRGTVIVTSERVGPTKVTLSVVDTGIGMTEEKLEQLRSIGKLTSSFGTSNEKGTGIGMVIVKEFVEANKGHFEVRSKVNEGTLFSMTFPMVVNTSASQSAPEQPTVHIT